MPQGAEQSLATGVFVRKRMSGLWLKMRAIMSVFDGLCRPIFCVLCDDDEVVLYACYLLFILRIVLLCGSLSSGNSICTVW